MNYEMLPENSTDSKTPDYSYENGLQIIRHMYGNTPSRTEFSATYDEMHPATSLVEQTPHQEKVIKTIGSTALEWRHIRSATESDTVNIMLMGWAGDNDNPITQDAFRYHVAHNPNADIIHINNPAHGESSILPGPISRKIAKNGHFAPQGEIHAELINEALKNYDHVNIAGHSYGGRQAIALAAALDRPVDNLHLLDPPGSRDLGGLPGIAKAFMSLEGKHASLYGKHAPDQAAAAIQRQGDSTPIQDILQLIRNKGPIQQFFDQTRAMSKAGLEHDLLLARPNVLNTVKFTSPALSELNYVDDVSAILDRVAVATRSIQHDIVIGHTHSMIASNPNTLAYVQRFS